MLSVTFGVIYPIGSLLVGFFHIQSDYMVREFNITNAATWIYFVFILPKLKSQSTLDVCQRLFELITIIFVTTLIIFTGYIMGN